MESSRLLAMKCKNCVGDVINVGVGVEVSVNKHEITEYNYCIRKIYIFSFVIFK